MVLNRWLRYLAIWSEFDDIALYFLKCIYNKNTVTTYSIILKVYTLKSKTNIVGQSDHLSDLKFMIHDFF